MSLLHPVTAHSSDTLFKAMGARLGHMKAVAHYKFIHQRPIEDLSREAIVIANAERAGHAKGLPAAPTRQFFATQITAAKAIQHYWFEQWLANPPPPNPTQLNRGYTTETSPLGRRNHEDFNKPR